LGAVDAVIVLGLLLISLAAGDSLPPAAAPGTALAGGRVSRAPRPGLRDSVILLPGIGVERERAVSDARRLLPTAFVTDLTAHTRGRAVEGVAELLSEAAGVHVERYGGLGSFSTVSLRGAAPGQVSVFLDGVPLTSAAHGVVSLGDLPATAIERVEIYRGLGPLGLGVATPGGAVNLVTAATPGLRELHLSRGSFATWEGRGTAGFQRGRLDLLVHAGYQGSAGDYRYLDDDGTPLNPSDDAVVRRLNDRFDAWSGLGSLTWRPSPGWRLLAREDWFQKAQGVPGLGAAPALSPRLTFLRALSLLDLAREGAGFVPRAALRLSANRERSHFLDTRLPDRGELGLQRHDTRNRFGADGLTLSLAWARPLEWLSLECAGSLSGEGADLHEAVGGVPDPSRSRRRTSGVMAELQLHSPDSRVVLHTARRWDRVADHLRPPGSGGPAAGSDVRRVLDSPQLGVRVGLLRGLELRANWARASRAPEFVELFGDQGSVTGNAELHPETAENRDGGAAWHGRLLGWTGALEWARFRSVARDLVVFVRNSASTVRPTNFGRSLIRGEEWSARLELPGRLVASAAWSWQSAINQGPLPAFWVGKRLPGRPGRQSTTRLEWRSGAWPDLRAAAELQVIGDNVLDPYNLTRVPERRLAGASLSVAPFRRPLAFTLEGRNLADVHAADVEGFPLPGRCVFFGCTWRVAPGAAAATEP
jgi:iron complex outermembrane receptor protein